MAPSVCSVTGTGIAGSGIGGIRLNTTISAANSAARTVSLVVIGLLLHVDAARRRGPSTARVDRLCHFLGTFQRTHHQGHEQRQRMGAQAARGLGLPRR
ncbi:Uncharacterised protein [Bordetella pertussis]|nr:Uncharacterised protein [Bordetella pertussis]